MLQLVREKLCLCPAFSWISVSEVGILHLQLYIYLYSMSFTLFKFYNHGRNDGRIFVLSLFVSVQLNTVNIFLLQTNQHDRPDTEMWCQQVTAVFRLINAPYFSKWRHSLLCKTTHLRRNCFKRTSGAELFPFPYQKLFLCSHMLIRAERLFKTSCSVLL